MDPQESLVDPQEPLPWNARAVLPWTLVAALGGLAVGFAAGVLAAELPEQVSASATTAQWVLAAVALGACALFGWLDRGKVRMVVWLAAPLGFLYAFTTFAL